MDVNFPACLKFTLAKEGGWSNNPKDPGGPTMKGITLPTYSMFLGRKATVTELRNIPFAHVASIYRLKYWHLIDGETLPAGIDMMAFDIAVNMGVGRAHQFLDQTANQPAAKRLQLLHALRMGFWKKLASWVTFGKGWTNRENDCLAACKALMAPH